MSTAHAVNLDELKSHIGRTQTVSDTLHAGPANLLRLEQYDHFYRPIIEIYFYLGRAVFGCDARPFHIVSVAIHLLNTLVLFQLARALTSNLLLPKTWVGMVYSPPRSIWISVSKRSRSSGPRRGWANCTIAPSA